MQWLLHYNEPEWKAVNEKVMSDVSAASAMSAVSANAVRVT